MSWHVNIIGTRENVNAAIQKAQHIPQPVKDLIAAYAAIKPHPGIPTAPDVIMVKSSGHYGPNEPWSTVVELSITPVTLAPPPPA